MDNADSDSEEKMDSSDELGPPDGWTTDGRRKTWKAKGNVRLPQSDLHTRWLFNTRGCTLVGQEDDGNDVFQTPRIDSTMPISSRESVSTTMLGRGDGLHPLDGVISFVQTICPKRFTPILVARRRNPPPSAAITIPEPQQQPVVAPRKKSTLRQIWLVLSIVGTILTIYHFFEFIVIHFTNNATNTHTS
jgi:hypothetical protein